MTIKFYRVSQKFLIDLIVSESGGHGVGIETMEIIMSVSFFSPSEREYTLTPGISYDPGELGQPKRKYTHSLTFPPEIQILSSQS